MMYRLIKNHNLDDLCIICVDKKVLDLEGTVVSDRNAAAWLAAFESPDKAKRYLDFDKIFLSSWNDDNYAQKITKGQIISAEVLVLNKVPKEYLVGILVCTDEAKKKVEELNLGIKVAINKKFFFQ